MTSPSVKVVWVGLGESCKAVDCSSVEPESVAWEDVEVWRVFMVVPVVLLKERVVLVNVVREVVVWVMIVLELMDALVDFEDEVGYMIGGSKSAGSVVAHWPPIFS